MRAKYGGGNDTIPKVKRKDSNLNAWIGILKVWDKFKENLIWRICDGNNTYFWHDHWIPGISNVKERALIDLNGEKLCERVCNYTNNLRSWNWVALSQVLPEEIVDHIQVLKTPTIGEDLLGGYQQ
ncbi:hypothetical protein AHAS_Ahas16G0235200 [Arachis hypogaea]